MTIKRSFAVFALGLAVALVATTAHAEQAKRQTKPSGKPSLKVDSPTMATSIRDWHPELAASPRRTAPTAACPCPCGNTVTQTATNMPPAGQRGNHGKRSGKPFERAREVPLSSLRP